MIDVAVLLQAGYLVAAAIAALFVLAIGRIAVDLIWGGKK